MDHLSLLSEGVYEETLGEWEGWVVPKPEFRVGDSEICDVVNVVDKMSLVKLRTVWFCLCRLWKQWCKSCHEGKCLRSDGKLDLGGESCGVEVFLCANTLCDHYYRPHCVSKSEHQDAEVATWVSIQVLGRLVRPMSERWCFNYHDSTACTSWGFSDCEP